jgi:hypothetical protein
VISTHRTRGAARNRRTARLLTSFGIGAAIVLGSAGCSWLAPQATAIEYSPSDGVSVPDSGPVDVRNALIVADESGNAGNLIAALVNTSSEEQTLLITIGDDSQTVQVPADESISLGVDEDPLLFEALDSLPGSTVDVIFASGDATSVLQPIPVLDGTLPYYEEFVPTGTSED